MIELRGVCFSHRAFAVLDRCDLRVDSGEHVALLGPSGIGKTTVLRLVAGLEAPSSGEVLIGGEVASGRGGRFLTPRERSIGYAFQELALWQHLTVAQHLRFGSSRAEARDRAPWIGEVVEALGIERLLDRLPAELSGGQSRRVEIARALARRPARLLLDEPMAHLDEAARVELRSTVPRLAESFGASVVWVTHDEAEARDVASRVVRMESGRCVG